jgi:ABC-type Fe3+/spermidine/putrescine transport system ATPase subunit
MPYLLLDRLAKSFGAQPVLRELTLAVEKGEVLALLGPSGSGKTTALRLIAGFERPDRGRIEVDGEEVTALPPEARRFGMVFQHYALFPHLTVAANVAFGLEAGRPRPDRAEVARRVDAALAAVGLAGFGGRGIGAISGGQQQRVAVARALAPEPRVLLLDEPLSNLDPTLRERTRRELKRTIGRIGITTVLVTHEQEEAFHLGDRVAVLEGGALHQVGLPEELYERPATRFVATFIGRASVLPAAPRLRSGTGAVTEAWIDLSGTPHAERSPDPSPERSRRAAWRALPSAEMAGAPAGTPADLVVRPEALRFVPSDAPDALAGRVAERRYGGTASTFLVEVAPGIEVEVLAGSHEAREGDTVAVALRPDGSTPHLYPRPNSPRGTER